MLVVLSLSAAIVGGFITLRSTGDPAMLAAPPGPAMASGSSRAGAASPSVAPPASPTASPSAVLVAPTPVQPTVVPAASAKLLFGIGTEADAAQRTALARQSPVKMLTSWYNGPNDLSWMAGWRTGTVPQAYSAGYALHLVVYSGDTASALSTSYGPSCGRAYPLSGRFADDMRQLAGIFAGTRGGPPLYVTMFTEFQTYPCVRNAWSPDAATTNYYRALQDQYRSAYQIFHQLAPNAHVSLGWGGWQASYDAPDVGGGRSLFGHFADVMKMSDFQSFQAMASDSNISDIRQMLAVLGAYGAVMIAHYKPDDGSQATFDADLHTILTDSFLSEATRAGLFAFSFMDNNNLAASVTTLAFVQNAVIRYGRGW